MKKSKKYYATLDRNGTEDEIVIHTPEGRPMLSVAFWDEPFRDDGDPAKQEADQIKADAALIVNALNAYRRKPAKRLMTAAPELLDALEETLSLLSACMRNAERLGQPGFAAKIGTMISVDRAAIAKAKAAGQDGGQ